MGAHQRKYGDLVTDAQMARYLRLQEAYLGEASTVFVDERGGDIRGFTLYYAHGGTLYSRAGGFDQERAAPFAYFNVSLYAPIRHAAEHGFTTLDLGLGSYRAKRLRGAEVTPLWSVVVPPERLESDWARVLGRPAPPALGAGVASPRVLPRKGR
jgi:predicted N-acyltransferase